MTALSLRREPGRGQPTGQGTARFWADAIPKQGWIIRDFDGARTPPQRTNATSLCQKLTLKKELNVHKRPFKIDIQ